MELILARPQGFCAGVERAIQIVSKAVEMCPKGEVYVYHEIVHNKYVLDSFRKRGVSFVEDVEAIPEGSVVIFSAHGVALAVKEAAKRKNLRAIDATCPLVAKVHKEAQRNQSKGMQVIIVGHPNHPEVKGTLGSINERAYVVSTVEDVESLEVSKPGQLSYVTQTTLSVDDTKQIIAKLKTRFPHIKGPELKDICFATQNRQNAVKKLIAEIDLLLVIGARNSSNSNRLVEVGKSGGLPSYLIGDAEEMDLNWFPRRDCKVGITSGASTPEILLKEVINYLNAHFGASSRWMEGIDENVKFPLPHFEALARA